MFVPSSGCAGRRDLRRSCPAGETYRISSFPYKTTARSAGIVQLSPPADRWTPRTHNRAVTPPHGSADSGAFVLLARRRLLSPTSCAAGPFARPEAIAMAVNEQKIARAAEVCLLDRTRSAWRLAGGGAGIRQRTRRGRSLDRRGDPRTTEVDQGSVAGEGEATPGATCFHSKSGPANSGFVR